MTAPTDPTAAIARLCATLPSLKTGTYGAALKATYPDASSFDDASRAFAADIETLASLTQVGWGIGYTIASDGEHGFELHEMWEKNTHDPKFTFSVYARVPQ